MNNKILIQLLVPEIEEKYDIFIPINRRVGTIMNFFNKSLNEITDGIFPVKNRCLYNHYSGIQYHVNDIVRETDIRNGTILVFI